MFLKRSAEVNAKMYPCTLETTQYGILLCIAAFDLAFFKTTVNLICFTDDVLLQ